MNNFLEINNGRYHIERIFSDGKTIADIIEKQVMAERGKANWLTNSYNVNYNVSGGSICTKEALQ